MRWIDIVVILSIAIAAGAWAHRFIRPVNLRPVTGCP